MYEQQRLAFHFHVAITYNTMKLFMSCASKSSRKARRDEMVLTNEMKTTFLHLNMMWETMCD